MRFITPIILFLIAIAVFFGYTDPQYDEIRRLKAESARFDEALKRAEDLRAVNDSLLATYESISSEDRRRLNTLLPDHVDTIRLIMELTAVADQYGLEVSNVNFNKKEQGTGNGQDGGSTAQEGLQSITMSFNITAPYTVMKQFLTDLEYNLRIMDLQTLKFSATPDDSSTYNISLVTYWLQ